MKPSAKPFLTEHDSPCLDEAAQKAPKIPIPSNEKKRLEVLWKYEVLDTPPDQAFDDLTELASCICEAPIALLSFVDENRQWFKAKVGVSLAEMSRNISFCGYTILEHGPMIVRDATADIRFADNPLVTCKPNIRFYAGMPLITPDGYALGTLCVLDQAPKELTEMQERGLRVLARFVMTQLDIRRHTRNQENVVAKLQKLEMELKHARAQLEQAEKELAPHT